MRITSPLGRRMTALLAAGAIAATLGVVTSAPAQAAPSLGTLSITPTTGTEASGLTADLSAACPVTATGIVGYMSGPGITEQVGGVSQSVLQSNRSLSTSFQISGIFRDVFQTNAIAQPSGSYTVRMVCIGDDFLTEVGEFAQTITFTPRAGTNNGNFVAQPAAKPATTTTLAAPTPADPVVQGASVTLSATVGAVSGTPTGTVQFKSGTTNVGSPATLSSGVATLVTTAVPAGAGNLTAVYVPGAANYATSTSNAISYVVAGTTTTNGTSKVGYTKGCTAVTGGTRTYSWLKNGVATGITTATVVVPASWLNATITCALTTTKAAVSVTRVSAGVKILAHPAPVLKVAPKVLGTAKVGKVLTCAHGTWSPVPTSYKYQWLRAGKVITGKTAVTYKAVALDKRKLVSCRVTTVKAGYLAGVKVSVGRKIL